MKSKNCGCKLKITRTSQATLFIYTGSLESVIGRRELAYLKITYAGHRPSTEGKTIQGKTHPCNQGWNRNHSSNNWDNVKYNTAGTASSCGGGGPR